MRSDLIIKHEGFLALKEKLNNVEIEKFISLIKRENFDYTIWRKDLFEDFSLEDLADKADEFSRNLN
jgi:hypothetical protein